MATSVGGVTIDLGLETAAFTRNVQKANAELSRASAQMRTQMRAVERAGREVSRQFSTMKSAAVAFAGALAVRQFTQFTRNAIEGGDAIAKQARQLDIAASTLQRYRIEGELAGVATAKLETGIGAFVKRVGELRAGTGTLVTILDRSNVALKEQLVAARTTEEGIGIVLNAIREAGTAFDKQALSAAAFGRQAGQAMVLLAESAGALDDRMVGLVTRSDEMLAASERLNDEITLLQSSVSAGFDDALVSSFAGSVNVTVESMTAAREAGESFGRLVGASMRAVVSVGRAVADNMREIATAIATIAGYKAAVLFGGIATSVIAMTKAMTAAAKSGVLLSTVLSKSVLGVIAKLAITLGAGALAWDSFGRDAVDAANEIDQAAEDIKRSLSGSTGAPGLIAAQASEFEQLRESLIPAARAQREFAEGVKLIGAAHEAGQISLFDYNLMLETLQQNLDEATKGTVALAKAQKEAADARAAAGTENTRIREETQAIMNGAQAWEDYKKAREIDQEVAALRKDLESAKVAEDQIRRLTEERRFLLETQQEAIRQHEEEQATYQELQRIGTRAFERIGAGITEMFLQGKSDALSWRNIMLSVISEIAQAFVQLAAQRAAASAFGSGGGGGGFLGSIFGSLFGGMSSSASAAAGGWGTSPLGEFGGTPIRLADGGAFDVGPGFPSISAGRDNRLVSFAARDGERVTVETPGMQRVKSEGMASAKGGDQYFIDARGADKEGLTRLEKMIQSVNGSIERRSVAAVADAQRRRRPVMRGTFG